MFAGRKIAVYADQRILLSFFYFHSTDLSIKEILSNKGSDLKQNSMRWYSNIELTNEPTSKSIHSKTINICKGRRGRDEMKLFSSRQPFRPSLHPQWMDVASCLLLPRWGGAAEEPRGAGAETGEATGVVATGYEKLFSSIPPLSSSSRRWRRTWDHSCGCCDTICKQAGWN